jgi:hypothetical protein
MGDAEMPPDLHDSETPPSRRDAERAAERAADDGSLLPGEEPASVHPADIEHWIVAYSELIAYKEALLSVSGKSIATMSSPEARRESGSVDVVILEFQVLKYRRRLAFWAARRDEHSSSR